MTTLYPIDAWLARRRLRGWSQRHLAALADIRSPWRYWRIERGVSQPDAGEARRIEAAFAQEQTRGE